MEEEDEASDYDDNMTAQDIVIVTDSNQSEQNAPDSQSQKMQVDT